MDSRFCSDDLLGNGIWMNKIGGGLLRAMSFSNRFENSRQWVLSMEGFGGGKGRAVVVVFGRPVTMLNFCTEKIRNKTTPPLSLFKL
jgi:hypothetical protein